MSPVPVLCCGIQSCCCDDRDPVGMSFCPETCSWAASCWLIWTRPHLGQWWVWRECEGYLVTSQHLLPIWWCSQACTCLWGENHLTQGSRTSFIPQTCFIWKRPETLKLCLLRPALCNSESVPLPGPLATPQRWCWAGGATWTQMLGMKVFLILLIHPCSFLVWLYIFFTMYILKLFFSTVFCTENATLENTMCSGQGGGAGGGALQVHGEHIGCQGFQSRLQNQAWSQIYSLPAVTEFLGPITSLWKEIIQEIASWQVRIAKIHSLESWCLQILFSFGHFSQVRLLGFHLMEAYLGQRENAGDSQWGS